MKPRPHVPDPVVGFLFTRSTLWSLFRFHDSLLLESSSRAILDASTVSETHKLASCSFSFVLCSREFPREKEKEDEVMMVSPVDDSCTGN